jgi:F0F1-type ATP synthase membrane subunit b/b'
MNAINYWRWDAHAPPIGWFAVNLLILVSGLAWAAVRPLQAAFAKRHRSIKEAIGAAASEHARAISEQRIWRDKLAGVEAEIHDLLERSAADGEKERQTLVQQAQAMVEGLQRDTSAQALQLQKQATQRLHQGLLEQILRRGATALRSALSPADRSRLTDDAIAALRSTAKTPAAAAE